MAIEGITSDAQLLDPSILSPQSNLTHEQRCLVPGDISLEELHSVATQNLIASTQETIVRELEAFKSVPPPEPTTQPDTASKDKLKKKKCKKNVRKLRTCPEKDCCKQYEWTGPLRYHTLTHKEKRQFHCEVEDCGRSFYTAQSLLVHSRTHTGERPFACSKCGKGFTTAGNLRNHARTHSGEKPFVCNVKDCAKSFTEYSSLRKHRLVHSGAKPFSCEVCGQGFSQSGSRNVHRRRAHPDLLGDLPPLDELEADLGLSSDSRMSASFSTLTNVIVLPETSQDFEADELFLPDELFLADLSS